MNMNLNIHAYTPAFPHVIIGDNQFQQASRLIDHAFTLEI